MDEAVSVEGGECCRDSQFIICSRSWQNGIANPSTLAANRPKVKAMLLCSSLIFYRLIFRLIYFAPIHSQAATISAAFHSLKTDLFHLIEVCSAWPLFLSSLPSIIRNVTAIFNSFVVLLCLFLGASLSICLMLFILLLDFRAAFCCSRIGLSLNCAIYYLCGCQIS